MTVATERITAPSVHYGGIAPRQGSSRPPQRKPAPTRDPGGNQPQGLLGTAERADENSLGWAIDTSASGKETKTTRWIMDAIDADTLRAALERGGTKQQIEVNRDRITALLGLRDEWKQPDEVYADEAWEICIIWRSGYGSVEIGTEEDGSITYYVSRTLSEEIKEGVFPEPNGEELDKVMSWLDKVPQGV